MTDTEKFVVIRWGIFNEILDFAGTNMVGQLRAAVLDDVMPAAEAEIRRLKLKVNEVREQAIRFQNERDAARRDRNKYKMQLDALELKKKTSSLGDLLGGLR